MSRIVAVGLWGALVISWAGCSGDDGQASMSDSAGGTTTTGGDTTTTDEAGSAGASESDTSTTSGASEGQTNTTDLSGSNSDSNSGSTSDTDTQGGTGSTSDTESGGGSGGTSTTTTTTGDATQCADHQDQRSCDADPKCQSIVGVTFKYIVSAWCLADEAFLGCIDAGEFCGGDPYTVCKGDEKYQLTNLCPPPDAMVCDPPPGGPEFKACT